MADLYLRTHIREELHVKSRKKSWIVAIASILLIAFSELILPLLELETLGVWAWLAATGAAGLAVLPQQKLKRQEIKPDVIHSTEEKLSYFQNNRCIFTLPWAVIDSFHYLDAASRYGLAFSLKTPVAGLSDRCRKEHGVDLFLPYFSHSSFLLLEKWRDQHVQETKNP